VTNTYIVIRDDDENRTAEFVTRWSTQHHISVVQTKQGQWQPARVFAPCLSPLSADQARAFAATVISAADLAEKWSKERPAELHS
jgi:hypothetical protein